MYFGDDFLLTSYFRPYVVRTLTYMDCFQLENTVISKLFQFGQFPRMQVWLLPFWFLLRTLLLLLLLLQLFRSH